MNSYLPFHPSASDALAIPAALGTLLGLYCFFRGLSLRHRASAARVNVPKARPAPATTTLTTTGTSTTTGSDTLTRDPRSEVIRLSPDGSEPDRAVSMSQQGKIAAALRRAGIPNPASWSVPAQDTPVAVKVTDSQARAKTALDSRQALDLKTSKMLKTHSDHRSLRNPPDNSAHSPACKPTFMLWGGALLALTSIYLLAALFRWL